MSLTTLTKEQESNLADFIRNCELDKKSLEYLDGRLTACEFDRDCGESRSVIALMIVFTGVFGYYIGRETAK